MVLCKVTNFAIMGERGCLRMHCTERHFRDEVHLCDDSMRRLLIWHFSRDDSKTSTPLHIHQVITKRSLPRVMMPKKSSLAALKWFVMLLGAM